MQYDDEETWIKHVPLHTRRHDIEHVFPSSFSLGRFDIIKKLGQGTYGKVQLGINKETGQEVAIKTIKKSKIETEADLIRIRREVQIMSSVQHPNIIHIYEGEFECSQAQKIMKIFLDFARRFRSPGKNWNKWKASSFQNHLKIIWKHFQQYFQGPSKCISI